MLPSSVRFDNVTAKTAMKPRTPIQADRARSRTVVLVAYDGCQSLDVNGPWEVFAKAAAFSAKPHAAPAYKLVLASPTGGTVLTNSGLQFGATVALRELRGPIDTILVSGGSDDALQRLIEGGELLPWLMRKARTVRRVGSVCTGAFAVAAAGLFDGRRATTHWDSCARLAAEHPLVHVEPDAIFVADLPFVSSAGVSAAIDLSLALVEADLGQAVALAVARDLVLFLRRPGGQSQFSAGLQAQARATPRLNDLLVWMVEHPEADLSVATLSERVSMSERHFARVFQSETGQTPARYVEALRLDRAKSHLEQTNWPLARVAQRAGFGSVDSLQRSLRRQAGITPAQYRQRFSRPAASA
jgi:transcriptional regulator GlxA family with amidase domain